MNAAVGDGNTSKYKPDEDVKKSKIIRCCHITIGHDLINSFLALLCINTATHHMQQLNVFCIFTVISIGYFNPSTKLWLKSQNGFCSSFISLGYELQLLALPLGFARVAPAELYSLVT